MVILLWVPWRPHSENKVRSQHWTVNHRHTKEANKAWLSVARSSPAVVEFWTTTMLSLASNRLEIQSPERSDLMTQTPASGSNTANAGPMELKEQS